MRGAPPRTRSIHAVLAAFPFAFLPGAFAFDLAGRWLAMDELWITGAHLSTAGVAAGALAGVAGAAAYRRAAAAGGIQRRRARGHALLHLLALGLFALTRWVRGAAAVEPDPPILFLEGVASGMVLLGAWLGGSLARAASARSGPARSTP